MTAPVWLRWLVRGRCRKTIFTQHPASACWLCIGVLWCDGRSCPACSGTGMSDDRVTYRKQVCHRLRFHPGECRP